MPAPTPPKSGNRTDRRRREEIRRQSLHIVDPNLKTEQHKTDHRQRDHRIVRVSRDDSRRHQQTRKTDDYFSGFINRPASADQIFRQPAAEQTSRRPPRHTETRRTFRSVSNRNPRASKRYFGSQTIYSHHTGSTRKRASTIAQVSLYFSKSAYEIDFALDVS